MRAPPPPVSEARPVETPEPSPSLLHLAAGGDLAYPTAWAGIDRVDADPAAMFRAVRPFFDDADLRFANLECPVTRRRPKAREGILLTCAPERVAYALDAGINLLSLANNHAGDAGIEGIRDTLGFFARPPRPVWAAGIGDSPDAALEPVSIRLPGKPTVALFAVSGYATVGSPIGRLDDPSLAVRIADASRAHDLVVVSTHGGAEYVTAPTSATVARYRALVAAGADVVLGHHAHVAQGFERYAGGMIFYGLGNLSFASVSDRSEERGVAALSILARLTLDADGVKEAEVVPLFTGSSYPLRASGERLDPILATPQPLRGAFLRDASERLQALHAGLESAEPLHFSATEDRVALSW